MGVKATYILVKIERVLSILKAESVWIAFEEYKKTKDGVV